MNMFLQELKSYRKSNIIWTLSLVTVVMLFMQMFPAFSDKTTQAVLDNFPDTFKKAFGISDFDFTTLLGFYGYIFSYVVLSGAIQAMNIGTGILSKEIREKTADFLLVKPVKRSEIVTAKLLAAVTSIIITNVFYIIASFVAVGFIKDVTYDVKIFVLMSLTLFFIQLIFIALGFFVSVVIKKIKSVLPISLGIVFGFFILEMFGSIIGEAKMKYLTPFKYFDLSYVIDNGKYELKFIVISIVLIAILIGVSYKLYSKKDVSAL